MIGREPDTFTPTDFVAVINQTLEYAFPSVTIVGEVASFKVNQGKWVFFDLKDEETSIPCFMTLWAMRQPLEDGMKVMVRGTPKMTKWGKFSFTVAAAQPVGEGSLKKAYEMVSDAYKLVNSDKVARRYIHFHSEVTWLQFVWDILMSQYNKDNPDSKEVYHLRAFDFYGIQPGMYVTDGCVDGQG